MTLFVASLYLPKTIDFHLGENAPKIVPAEPKAQSATPNLIQSLASKLGSKQPSPPSTPAGELAGENFFLKSAIQVSSAVLGLAAPATSSRPAISRQLTQPRSRASSPPPSNILQARPGFKKEPDIEAVSGAPKPHRVIRRRPSVKDQAELFKKADWTVENAEKGNGGLRQAIRAAEATKAVADVTWVGTLGMSTDILEDHMKQQIEDKLRDEYDCLPVFCKDRDFDGHYRHFCKQILWPVFHYQIPDNPKSKAYEDHSWIYYLALNQAFADVIIKNYKKGDTIWVHDYHLLLVPKLIRDKIPDATIGFFLHVAFPSSEVYRCLAVRKQLLEGMLGANLIGFQTTEYSRHFLQTCNRILCVETNNEGVLLEDRIVNIESLPIGIDPVYLSERREDPEVDEWRKIVKDKFEGVKIIFSRDKLDLVRGIRQKLLSYELFLKHHPEWLGKVILIQVCTTSDEVKDLQGQCTDVVGRLEARAQGIVSHKPVVFIKQDLAFSRYLALLTEADALMITSLREGMNLTSHEYIFCQDEKMAPLIISEFTGSAAYFDSNEIAVNPWDYRQCADAINTALTMKDDERKMRWQKLYAKVMENTGTYWVTKFVGDLQRVWLEQQSRGNLSIPRLSMANVGTAYLQSDKRLFLLDWEGTLITWGKPGEVISSGPQRILDCLNDLLADSRNVVYVSSSKTPELLEPIFRRVAGLGLIAENGCFIRPHNDSTWVEMVDASTLSWQSSVAGILEYYKERTPGTTVERRHCSFVFNLEDADDKVLVARQAGECVNHINDSCENQRIHAVPLENRVVVEPMDFNKATAAAKVVELMGDSEPDFLFVAGNDREDEVVFKWAKGLGEAGKVLHVSTVCVGARNSEAEATVQGAVGMVSALQKLTSSK